LRFAGHDALELVELDEGAYRAASFLDERLLVRDPRRANCELALVGSAAMRLESRAHYLFHIGHVGSTLVSRLIGAHESFFSLREPALLRAFADPTTPPAGLSLDCVLALLARTWRPAQRAVIKATSLVNEAAETILGGMHRPAAIFIYATPQNYLRGIFAGPNSRVESKALVPGRKRRLERRFGAEALPPIQTEGEWVAMNWLSEMSALHRAAQRFEAQVLWMDFDGFLQHPETGLSAIFQALGAQCPMADIESLASGPIMRQYSKAPEHSYDAALRREVLESADWQHGAEIKRGLQWLGRIASGTSEVHDLLAGMARRLATSRRIP
jgi:hypothetical protein